MNESITYSSPGSLMLMGEHAVLHGEPCLVTAVGSRMQVSIRPLELPTLRITSNLGQWEAHIGQLRVERPFQFIITAVMQHMEKQLEREFQGLEVSVESEFASTLGLGSSAAVTAAVHAGLLELTGTAPDQETVFDLGLQTIRSVQGRGSGADLAASVRGGTVYYQAEPRLIEGLAPLCPLTAVYSGSKKPTAEVIRLVAERFRRWPELHAQLYTTMGVAVRSAREAILREDWVALGELMNVNQGLMDALGVNNPRLSEIVFRLRETSGIFGAKISGSGLGDCAIGLGLALGTFEPFERINVCASGEGLCRE